MELFLWWCAAFLALACAVSMLRTRMLEHFPRGPTLCNRGPATTVGAAGGERRQDAGAVSASAGTSRGAAGTPSPAAAPAVLLLIAHPDDEAMFFVPTILAIAKEHTLYMMSISNGDYDGLGKTREEELKKSCALLQIPDERITIIDDPGLQDGPKNMWDTRHVAFYLLPHVKRHNICAIITFDGYGVSGHPNHIALCEAVRELSSNENGQLPHHIKLWSLQSVGLWRKFVGPLAVLEDDFLRLLGVDKDYDKHYVTCSLNASLVRRCLQAHRSQAVWYRWLFIYFSRYSFFNRLAPIHEGR